MEGALPEETTQSVAKSFVEQHRSVLSEIIANFTQIELNITDVDNAHAIESNALGTKDILKLDDLEVNDGNKQRRKAQVFASRGFADNYSRRPLHDSPPWST